MLFFRVCNYAAKLRIKSKTTKNNVISPSWRKLAARVQFTIQNSLPVLPVPLVPLVAPVLPIQNSEFKILSLSHNRRCGSPSQPSHTSHTSHLPHTCIVLIV